MTYRKNLIYDWQGIRISLRTFNCFRNNGITNIEQLLAMTQADFLRWNNFGRKSLNEVIEQLQEKGLSIRRDVRDPRHSPEGEKLFKKYIQARQDWEFFRENYYVVELRRKLKELEK